MFRIKNILAFIFLFFIFNYITFLFINYLWFSVFCQYNYLNLIQSIKFVFVPFIINLPDIVSITSTYMYISCRWFYETILIADHINFNIYNTRYERLLDNEGINTYCIYFDTKVVGLLNIYFYGLQNKLYVLPGETTLSFFRVYNDNDYGMRGFAIYTIFPFELSPYFLKIQCFCFEEIFIYSCESLELPVLFYLNSSVLYDASSITSEVSLEYLLMSSRVD